MTQFKYNRVLLILIVAGLLASLAVCWQRHKVEENNSRVDIVIDYEDVVELAQMDGIPVPALMARFKEAGITSLAVYEKTLEKLQKQGTLTILSGADLLARYRTGEGDKSLLGDPALINPAQIYIFTERKNNKAENLFAEVREDLISRLGPDRVHMLPVPDNLLGMAVDAHYEKVIKWNLGLSTAEMDEVTAGGFGIVARPSNYTKVKPDDITAVFARLSRYDNISGIMFTGEEALGYPGLLPLTASLMQERGLSLYMIEHPLQLQFLKQEGLLDLAAANNFKAARAYVIPKEEQPKLLLDEAIHRWLLSDQERNIRVNLLRKFDKTEPGLNLSETNLKYVAGVQKSLLSENFTTGPAGTYAPFFPQSWLLAIITIGATAAGVLFLTLVKPFGVRYQYILLLILAAVLCLPLLKGSGLLARQAVAAASASLFPVLAMTWQLDRWRQKPPFAGGALAAIIVDGVLGLVLTVFLSLIGGLYVAAILGDVRFILEMTIFRGVKLTFAAPLILITLTYLARFDLLGTDGSRDNIVEKITRILNYPVYVKTLLLAAVGGLAAWVFIGRSGHTAGVPVPALEIKLRTFLEQVMYARPREKEFMIGHPAFMLAVMALYRNWPRFVHYIFVVAATIGQGSLVETFAHIRTPVYMSFIRGIDGLIVGAILGVFAVVAVQALHYSSFLLGRRPAADE